MTTTRALRIFAWLLLAALVFVTLAPIGFRPHTSLPPQYERAIGLTVVAFVWVLAYPRRAALIAGLLVVLNVLLEATQLIDPTRHGRLIDLWVKVLGVAVGATAAWLLAKWRSRQLD